MKTDKKPARRGFVLALSIGLFAGACSSGGDASAAQGDDKPTTPPFTNPESGKAFVATEMAVFDEPWAMAFLPNGSVLVTERAGQLKIRSADGKIQPVTGVPDVDYGGQGGLGDIVLAPDYAETGHVYLSWAEAGAADVRGAAVARAKLDMRNASAPALTDLQILWKQEPKVSGRGHYSHCLAFSPDGQYLYIGSGDRQKMQPAQDKASNLGKIIRLTATGGIPSDNPYYDQGSRTAAMVWSMGHRNVLGLAFDQQGRLWDVEMGPKGGDELNLVGKASNYGWPIVSEGEHYDGAKIPAHSTRPDFAAPAASWNPVISPSSLIFYSGDVFPQWKGNAFISGLSSESLVRVAIEGDTAREVERFAMGKRIRTVSQGPDGALWLLEDGKNGRLLRLAPSTK